MLVAGIRHLLAAVAFRQHDHAAAIGLQLIDVGVHAPCGSGSKRTRCVSLRRFGRSCVVNRVIFHVLRQPFAVIQTLLQFCMGNITPDDNGAIQRQTR
ncbi:hypothetical protein D3C80_1255210 [compost metagenome]